MIFWIIFLTLIAIYLLYDFFGPFKVSCQNTKVFGVECLKASDFIVQEYDGKGNLWVSRGMKIYVLYKSTSIFVKYAHVPTGINIYWLRNFTLFRKLTLRPECIEFTVLNNGNISVFSAGYLFLYENTKGKFKKVHKIDHYGKGDQGLRNTGILKTKDEELFFGEYFRNKSRGEVKILKSTDKGENWNTSYTFDPGITRHIHAVQEDPYSSDLFCLTGDWDNESFIAYSEDSFNSIKYLGKGNQTYRVCQLVFDENYIFWGTDTSEEKTSGFFRYDRKNQEVTKIGEVHGAIFFATRLNNGIIAFTSNRENNKLEVDDYTRLYLYDPDTNNFKTIKMGTWDSKKAGFWFKYAQLRIQRYQGAHSLAITFLNLKEFPDSELLIFKEEDLFYLKGVED